MTGELPLRGRVLPIGGVKEKVLGAVRAGITAVVLPKENEADLEDLPEEVRDTIEVHLVDELGDIINIVEIVVARTVRPLGVPVTAQIRYNYMVVPAKKLACPVPVMAMIAVPMH